MRIGDAGDPVEHFYIVSRGELSVQGEDGLPLGTIGEGEALGEISLLAGKQRRTKTVTCASPACEVVAIGRADFLRLMEKSRVVYESMQKVAHRRMSQNETTEAENDAVLRRAAAR